MTGLMVIIRVEAELPKGNLNCAISKEEKMKTLKLAILGVLAAGSSFAGTVAYVAPEVVAIEEPARMGGSGAWIIPLVLIAFLAFAFTQGNDEEVIID